MSASGRRESARGEAIGTWRALGLCGAVYEQAVLCCAVLCECAGRPVGKRAGVPCVSLVSFVVRFGALHNANAVHLNYSVSNEKFVRERER